jgi:ornithine carbamoyltransferase
MSCEQARARWQASNPPRHYLSITDLTRESAETVLALAHAMKRATQGGTSCSASRVRPPSR